MTMVHALIVTISPSPSLPGLCRLTVYDPDVILLSRCVSKHCCFIAVCYTEYFYVWNCRF